MKKRYLVPLAAIIGFFSGGSVGIAFAGSAFGGGPVLAGLSAVLAWIWPTKQDGEKGAMRKPEDEREDQATNVLKDGYFLAGDVMAWLGRALRMVWNWQMDLFAALGVLPAFVAAPWLFLVLGFGLLAIVFPLGVIFTMTGAAAVATGDPRASNGFRVIIG